MRPSTPDDRPANLLVAGHVNVDRFLAVRSFPAADRTVPVTVSRSELGGTATNLALVATRYGVPTGLIARVGEEFPAEYRSRLDRAGIDLAALEVVPGVSTPTCYILEDSRGGQRTLIDQGAMDDSVRWYRSRDRVRGYSWLHVTTGPVPAHLDLIARARAAGVRVAVDPAQEIHYRWDRPQFLELLAGAEVLFGNSAEIERACLLARVGSPEGLLDRVPLIVRTEGPKGATAFSRAGRLHVPSPRPRRRRTIVGAGDAFRGGFYAAWFAGQPLKAVVGAGAHAATRWIEGER